MAMDREDILELAKLLRGGQDPTEVAQREARIAAQRAQQEKLEKETKKNKTHAFYEVTGEGFITGIGRVSSGQVIALPLKDKHGDPIRPPHTWKSVPPDADTTEAEPKPEQPKQQGAVRVPEKPKQQGKPTRAADEDA